MPYLGTGSMLASQQHASSSMLASQQHASSSMLCYRYGIPGLEYRSTGPCTGQPTWPSVWTGCQGWFRESGRTMHILNTYIHTYSYSSVQCGTHVYVHTCTYTRVRTRVLLIQQYCTRGPAYRYRNIHSSLATIATPMAWKPGFNFHAASQNSCLFSPSPHTYSWLEPIIEVATCGKLLRQKKPSWLGLHPKKTRSESSKCLGYSLWHNL